LLRGFFLPDRSRTVVRALGRAEKSYVRSVRAAGFWSKGYPEWDADLGRQSEGRMKEFSRPKPHSRASVGEGRKKPRPLCKSGGFLEQRLP